MWTGRHFGQLTGEIIDVCLLFPNNAVEVHHVGCERLFVFVDNPIPTFVKVQFGFLTWVVDSGEQFLRGVRLVPPVKVNERYVEGPSVGGLLLQQVDAAWLSNLLVVELLGDEVLDYVFERCTRRSRTRRYRPRVHAWNVERHVAVLEGRERSVVSRHSHDVLS